MLNTIDQIKNLIVKKLAIDPSVLVDDKPMIDFGMDSLSQIELLFEIEEHFKIRVPEDKYQIRTLLDLAAAVDEILATPPSSSPEVSL